MDLQSRQLLWDALAAPGPDPGLEERLQLFGQFVGSWNLDFRGEGADGGVIEAPGEVHFGWALGGRAVQDVWVVPGRDHLDPTRPPLFWGTTIRFPDIPSGMWRSTWVEPVQGRVRRFVGYGTNGRIVLDGIDDTEKLRWSFTDITATTFRWVGEVSTDGGATWRVEEEMQASRVR